MLRKPKNEKKSGIAIDKISDRYLRGVGIVFGSPLLLYRIISAQRKVGEIVWPLAEPSALLCLSEPAAAADGDTAQLTTRSFRLHIPTAGRENKTKK